jgi:hypothetical protein
MEPSLGWFEPVPRFWMSLNLLTGIGCAVLAWLAQLRWYPSLRAADAPAFRAVHDRHLRRLAWLAPPVMLADFGASVWLGSNLWYWWGDLEWGSIRPFGLYASAAIAATGIAWVSTFLLQVPLHRRLEGGRDAPALDALLSTNRLRVAAWSAKVGILAVWLALPAA